VNPNGTVKAAMLPSGLIQTLLPGSKFGVISVAGALPSIGTR